ncbi:antibiotic biosynthesis monooxygenase [Vibrio sp. D404a]|uniref:putative quinol monooxygenase n=1 Tax=unclassified Vibrio TaxID=2614977 RepID=UPI002555776B|nr:MULTISPECIES: antibiotic biosynthesis monooxygenase [unclassified Vibrio]MDK9736951.1 antibiotic biosynthesis monooxygenase [Vibrio sp. D404a]MDK9798098.1 antibiotic biosynthesis monooxygenase [Vibrio sp. D449a]
MSKIVLSGHIKVPLDDLNEVLAALPIHYTLTHEEPGCLVFEVTQDQHDPQIFHVYEEFIDKQAFEQHQHRVKHSDWGNKTARVERHYQVTDSGQP